MGNSNAKKENEQAYERDIAVLFSSLSRNEPTINYIHLKEKWASNLDPYLYGVIESYFMREHPNGLHKADFKKFFVGLCKGNTNSRAENLLRLIGNGSTVSKKKLLKFVSSTVGSTLIIQRIKCERNFKSWHARGATIGGETSLLAYGKYLLNAVGKRDKSEFDCDDVRHLLLHFDVFLSAVMSFLYDIEDEICNHLLPAWRYAPLDSGRTLEEISVLNLVRLIFINLELPIDYQEEWRLLFSTSVDGENFSRLMGHITNKGPTVIIVEDKGGNIFGGFASVSWTSGPNFHGNSASFLFMLSPDMELYSSSGFNSNFQYLNANQQTMPNGLGEGMGGKLEYFGLWLSAEFGFGRCSESCTTYRNYRIMSSTKDFCVSHLEVWGVGAPPFAQTKFGERCVLDREIEAKAILQMAGRAAYSEGLRDKPKN